MEINNFLQVLNSLQVFLRISEWLIWLFILALSIWIINERRKEEEMIKNLNEGFLFEQKRKMKRKEYVKWLQKLSLIIEVKKMNYQNKHQTPPQYLEDALKLIEKELEELKKNEQNLNE